MKKPLQYSILSVCTMNKGSKGMLEVSCDVCWVLRWVKFYSISHVRGVKRDSKYTKDSNAMHVEGLKRSLKWSYISLLITLLIYN